MIDFWSHNISQGMMDRDLIPENNITDVMYEDFIKNPLLEIKNIYSNLQLDMTIEVENNIQSHLSQGRIKSKSKHRYSIQDFDISEENIRHHFRDYMLKYNF